MPDERPLAAAILFGGRAERMGSIDKSSLTIGHGTVIERLLEAVRTVADPVIAVGDRYGAATRAGLDVVADVVPDAGALGGIHAAIVRSPHERVLVVGCDMPFVSARFLRHLAAVGPTDVVMPRDNHGWQPLCAIYTRACAAPILERLARGERHAAVPPSGVRVTEIGPAELADFDPEGLLFVNVNTPHDYERARRIVEAGRAPA